MQSLSLAAGLESFVCAESGHRPPHGWRSLDLVQSIVQESCQGVRDRSRLLPALTGASDVLVAQEGHSPGKIVVLMFIGTACKSLASQHPSHQSDAKLNQTLATEL
jgi:hypothetical protein